MIGLAAGTRIWIAAGFTDLQSSPPCSLITVRPSLSCRNPMEGDSSNNVAAHGRGSALTIRGMPKKRVRR